MGECGRECGQVGQLCLGRCPGDLSGQAEVTACMGQHRVTTGRTKLKKKKFGGGSSPYHRGISWKCDPSLIRGLDFGW